MIFVFFFENATKFMVASKPCFCARTIKEQACKGINLCTWLIWFVTVVEAFRFKV